MPHKAIMTQKAIIKHTLRGTSNRTLFKPNFLQNYVCNTNEIFSDLYPEDMTLISDNNTDITRLQTCKSQFYCF